MSTWVPTDRRFMSPTWTKIIQSRQTFEKHRNAVLPPTAVDWSDWGSAIHANHAEAITAFRADAAAAVYEDAPVTEAKDESDDDEMGAVGGGRY